MLVTALVSQLPTSNDVIFEQPENISLMLVTALVFQSPTVGGAVMAEQPWNMLFITETALVSNLSAPSNAVMFQQSENQYAQLLGAIICPSAMRADLTLERWLYHGAEFQFVPVFSTPVYTWPVYVLPMMSVTV
jgi:hypothetical protein